MLRFFLSALVLTISLRVPVKAEVCPAPRSTIAVKEKGVIKWSDCTEDKRYREDFVYPAKARVFPFRSKVLKQPFGEYSADLTKVDIVWLDDTITINEPLLSFGGDIILFADTLNINSTIDSRVYIEHGVDNFSEGNPSVTTSQGHYRTSKTSQFIRLHPDYVSAFTDYYNKCIDCLDLGTRLPEMPAGLAADTPAVGGLLTRDGGDAPGSAIVDRRETASGSIYIFARTINVRKDLQEPIIPPYRAECTGETTTFVPYAINAGGVHAGRGGPGSVSTCVTHPKNNPFDCHPAFYNMKGGYSGFNGSGGDAGDVTIALINDSPATETIQSTTAALLTKITSVKGGEVGEYAVYQTPAAEGPDRTGATRCSFKRISVDAHHVNGRALIARSPHSSDGTFSLQSPSKEDAINSLVSLLASKDLRLDYDYLDYLTIANADDTIYSTQPSTIFTDFLVQQLLAAETRHIADVEAVFGLGQADKGGYLSPLFSDFKVDSLEGTALSGIQSSLLVQLTEYNGSDGVFTPFENSGGMFHVPGQDQVYKRMLAGQLRTDIAVQRKTLERIKGEMRDINLQMFTYISERNRADLKARIARLQEDISQAESEAERAAQQDPGLWGTITALKDFASSLAEFIGALYTENYPAAATSGVSAAKAFQKLQNIERPVLSTAGKLEVLRSMLLKVTQGYEAFSTFVSDTRSSYFAEKLGDIHSLLNARFSLVSKLQTEAFIGPDMLKIAIMSYFADSAGRKTVLRRNLEQIRRYFTGFPDADADVAISQIDWDCTHISNCMNLDSESQRWRIVTSQFDVADKKRTVPLYILKPSASNKPLLVLGMPSIKTEFTQPRNWLEFDTK